MDHLGQVSDTDSDSDSFYEYTDSDGDTSEPEKWKQLELKLVKEGASKHRQQLEKDKLAKEFVLKEQERLEIDRVARENVLKEQKHLGRENAERELDDFFFKDDPSYNRDLNYSYTVFHDPTDSYCDPVNAVRCMVTSEREKREQFEEMLVKEKDKVAKEHVLKEQERLEIDRVARENVLKEHKHLGRENAERELDDFFFKDDPSYNRDLNYSYTVFHDPTDSYCDPVNAVRCMVTSEREKREQFEEMLVKEKDKVAKEHVLKEQERLEIDRVARENVLKELKHLGRENAERELDDFFFTDDPTYSRDLNYSYTVFHDPTISYSDNLNAIRRMVASEREKKEQFEEMLVKEKDKVAKEYALKEQERLEIDRVARENVLKEQKHLGRENVERELDDFFFDLNGCSRYYTDSDCDPLNAIMLMVASEREKREQFEKRLVKEKDKIAKECNLKERVARESVLKEQKQLEKNRLARERAAKEKDSKEWLSKEKDRSNELYSQWLAEETSKLKLTRNRKAKKKEETISTQAIDRQMMVEQERLEKGRVLQEQKRLQKEKLARERASKERENRIEKERVLKERKQLEKDRIARENVLKKGKQLEKDKVAREHAAKAETELSEWLSEKRTCPTEFQWLKWLAEDTSKQKSAKKKKETDLTQAVDRQMVVEQERLEKERVSQEQKRLQKEKLSRERALKEQESRIEKERVLKERKQLEKDKIARENILKKGKQLEKVKVAREHAAKAETELSEWLSEERDCPTEFQWLRWLAEDTSKQKSAKKKKKQKETDLTQAVDRQMVVEQERLEKERVSQEQKRLQKEKLARELASKERENRIEKERVLKQRKQLQKDRIARENVLKKGKQLEKDKVAREHAAKAETKLSEQLSEDTSKQNSTRNTNAKKKKKVAKQMVEKSREVLLMPTPIPRRLNATLLTGQVTSNIKTVHQNKKLMCYIFISLGCDDKYLKECSLYKLRTLSKSNKNYEIVKNKIKVDSNSYLKNVVIEHVNNPYIKALYELKKLEMRNRFGKALKEQYMFHATQTNKVNSILSTNLNHRLCGTQRGTRYGHGMSFSPTFYYSTLFCERKLRKKVMFCCNVLFVKAHIGDENTIVPLEGYDSTKRGKNQIVLVKYDDDVFYPTYKITFDMFNTTKKKD